MRNNGGVKPRFDHPWNVSQDAAEEIRSALAAARDPRPVPGGTGGFRRAMVVAMTERGAGGVVVDWPGGRVRRRLSFPRPRAAVFLPTAPTFLGAQTVDPILTALPEAPDVLIVEEDSLRPGAFGLADHLGVRWGIPSVALSARCAGDWDEPPPGLDGAHVFVKDGGAPVALAVRPRAHRPPLFVAPGHRMDLMGALDVVLSLPLDPRRAEPRALGRARAALAAKKSRAVPRRRKVL